MTGTLETIARELGFETLEERGHDKDDFHEVHVTHLRRALEAAYQAGAVAGASIDPLLAEVLKRLFKESK